MVVLMVALCIHTLGQHLLVHVRKQRLLLGALSVRLIGLGPPVVGACPGVSMTRASSVSRRPKRQFIIQLICVSVRLMISVLICALVIDSCEFLIVAPPLCIFLRAFLRITIYARIIGRL